MKKLISCMLLILVSSCTFENEHGRCIGITDEGNPNLTYEVNIWNTIVSAIFIEAVFPPVLWVVTCGKCPAGKK